MMMPMMLCSWSKGVGSGACTSTGIGWPEPLADRRRRRRRESGTRDRRTGGARGVVALLELVLQILERVARLLEGAAARWRRRPSARLDLVAQRELVARDLLREAADLLGNDGADAEDDRERAHHHEAHGVEVGSPPRRSNRTAGARTNDRMTASASGTSTTWPKYSASTMMKPTTASSMAEPRDGRRGDRRPDRRGAIYLGVGHEHPARPTVAAITTKSRGCAPQRLRRRAALRPNRNAAPTTCSAPK